LHYENQDSESDDHDGAKERSSPASSNMNMYGALADPPMKLPKPTRHDSGDASGDDSAEAADDDEHSDDEDDDGAAPPIEGTYDPAEYENLNVSAEIRELFGHIVRYTPQTIELETRFKPFIPEYIPAVGDIDAFIKVGIKYSTGLCAYVSYVCVSHIPGRTEI
jgi:intraflagellar transport protein 46